MMQPKTSFCVCLFFQCFYHSMHPPPEVTVESWGDGFILFFFLHSNFLLYSQNLIEALWVRGRGGGLRGLHAHLRWCHCPACSFLFDFLMRDLWICGMTPPPAIVALMSVSSSSSPRIAN